MADMVVDLIDVGAGPGTLEMQTATGFEVVTSQFSKPAFADAANGIAIAAPIESGISESGGTIALAVARDSEGSEVFRCSVTAVGGGGSIELGGGVVMMPTQTITLTDLSYEAPP
ncbi:MAG: hypothetical protein WBW99_18170 [Pseudolabrys sp.]